MSITLYLMTQKGFEIISHLTKKGMSKYISCVIVGRDNNVNNDYSEDIIEVCENNNIAWFWRNENYKVTSSYSIAISWKWIIHSPESKLIILHDGLLPKYRGFAPLVSALINREEKVGVTAIWAAAEYDKGEIIAQESIVMNYPIRIKDVIDKITLKYVSLVDGIFEKVLQGKSIQGIPQNEDLASYSLWRDEEDYVIDWSESADQILSFIYAVSEPYKGASTFINGVHKIRIIDAEVVDDVDIKNRDNGKVIFNYNKFPVIVCGTGLLKITNAYFDKDGKNAIPFKKFRTRLMAKQTKI